MAVLWLYVLMAVLLAEKHANAFWWPFSSGGEPSEESRASVEVARQAIPFEMRSAEQKFLAEAQQYLDLSPLEACQYRVISELRKTCGELGEDELGKMSVALLNCQSAAEKRQTFQCTKDMSLAECTADMDPHVWNAYHIISNRARSVCYATRQQQFRRQTEAVVNKLSSSTLEQLQAMENLAARQSEVKELAVSSLSTLHEYHKESEAREQEVAQRQEGMKERIAQNLEQLTQEKVLIHSGQQLLANMTEDIKRQLEVASSMLGSQEQNLKQSQREILDDITTVRHNIQQVWGRIDNSTSQLLTVLEEISSHYKSTLDSLQVINETLAGMQGLVEGMSSAVNGQLDWVVAQLGGANRGLRVLSSCAAHTLFLLVSTLCVVFVKAPGAARVFLLLSVVGNAVLDIRVGMSLTFSALAVVETAAVLFNWLYLSVRYRRTTTHIPHLQLPPQPTLPFEPHLAAQHFVYEESPGRDSMEDEEITTKPYNTTPLHTSMASRNLTPQFKAAETLCSTPAKEHSVSSQRCSALTHNGVRCRLRAMTGSSQCHRHEGQ